MSCWVVPSVAAELWGCTVDAVMAAMRNGNVPTKEDSGWMFVDVAPDSPTLQTPKAMRPPTPDTFAIISNAEAAALTEPMSGPMTGPMASGMSGGSESDSNLIENWRKIRESVSASRRAPLSKAA